jgi:hypothetical protein
LKPYCKPFVCNGVIASGGDAGVAATGGVVVDGVTAGIEGMGELTDGAVVGTGVLNDVAALVIGVAIATAGDGAVVEDGAVVGVAPPQPASTTTKTRKPSQPSARRCTVATFSIYIAIGSVLVWPSLARAPRANTPT